MAVVLVTGSAGLVGAECVRFFARQGFDVAGIDNDSRQSYFGREASTEPTRRALEAQVPGYRHWHSDIRDQDGVQRVFSHYGKDIRLVVHTAAQPSHDWATEHPDVDFAVNAGGTMVLLEATRRHCPDAVFVFTSTNKVYGEHPNRLPLRELPTRWEIEPDHAFAKYGIDESMSVDQTRHSLYGVSKLAADALVQEYGRLFGLKTGCFRAGCLTGPGHAASKLHGFLAYLVRCGVRGVPYQVLGYQGKQVRDNLHAEDLVGMFWEFFRTPQPGEVYNVGGGRHANCSILEAIALCEELTGRLFSWTYDPHHRTGDHLWYVSDVRKFQAHYPDWAYRHDLRGIVAELVEASAR